MVKLSFTKARLLKLGFTKARLLKLGFTNGPFVKLVKLNGRHSRNLTRSNRIDGASSQGRTDTPDLTPPERTEGAGGGGGEAGTASSIDPIDRTKRKVEASDGRDPGACDRRRSQRVIEEEVSMIDYDEARRPR